MGPQGSKFFFSILTAVGSGIGAALIVISAGNFLGHPEGIVNTIGAMTSATKNLSAAVSTIDVHHLISQDLVYEAQAEEEAGNDITFTGEPVDSSGQAITALAYSVQSLDKNNILVEKDSEKLLPIASITKLVTAVMAEKLFKPDDKVTITQNVLNTEGTTGGFRLGETYKISEIFYPLLLVSSNDAAEAISQGYDAKHGRGAFVREMNTWTSDIGAYRTYFRDASGLSYQNVSTARDLSIIVKWIHDNEPDIFAITLTKAKTIRLHTWVNPTHFLNLSSYNGGKNGFTDEAHQTNVSIFSLGDPKRLYSVVLLGGSARDKDTLSVLNEAVK